MTLPDFLIAGAQKAGTTWLARRLAQHPRVYMADGEPHFFDRRHNFQKGADWYASLFDGAAESQMVGEKTPDYMWAWVHGLTKGHLTRMPGRISDLLPEVRLIFLLRDPVERAVSATKHLVISGRLAPWHDLDALLAGDKRELLKGHGVITKGCYARQLAAYLEHFPRERILVLIFEEDVVRSPRRGLSKVCRFLQIDERFDFSDVETPENPSRADLLLIAMRWLSQRGLVPSGVPDRIPPCGPVWRPSVSQETRSRLAERYREENRKLFGLIGRDVPAWTR